MKSVELVVFDMAGTTVQDDHIVEQCFYEAAVSSGLEASKERIKAMQGLAKRFVITTLWEEVLGKNHPEIITKVDHTFDEFRRILENYYLSNPVHPTIGAIATFDWLKANNIKIALTTGFYRKVANIILNKLGWLDGLQTTPYYRGDFNCRIQLSLTSDDTKRGRPHPDLIFKAMEILKVDDPMKVIKIGDTPSDLEAGKSAGCLLSLGVTNGTHTYEDLAKYPNDGLIDSLQALPKIIEQLNPVAH